MHCLPPGGPGEALERRFFRRALKAERRLTLTDPMHALRGRLPLEAPAPGPAVRLVTGPAPFGYLDDLDCPVVYLLVLGDPAAGFLRFAEQVRRAEPEARAALAGPRYAGAATDDLDAAALRLLETPMVRRQRLNAATRLCAGVPLAAAAGEMDGPVLLRAALANLARANLFVGREGALDAFAGELAGVFGWRPSVQAVEPGGGEAARTAAPAAQVRPETLTAVTEATALDAALLRAATQAERLDA